LEDLLNQEADSSDWGLDSKVVGDICSEFQIMRVIDMFALSTWHVCDQFVSLVYTPGCAAAQALALGWRALVPPGEFAWIFPPVRHISEIVQKIERFWTNSVLVVPEQVASNWWIRIF
jgi:hypothetical protein